MNLTIKEWPGIWIVAAALAAATAVFAALFPMLATDTACRYAPMAEAFARGEWAEAFHPRFGVGMSVLAGSASWLFGLDGYSSCSMIATLAWALGVVPVYRVAERVFDRHAAWFAVVLYAICPQHLVWGLKGLREPFKVLGVLLMADAVLRRRAASGWLSAAEAALGFASLSLFKSDAILPACVLALAYGAYDRFRVRTLALYGACALTLQPLCLLVWTWTGYWLPAQHFVPLWQKVFGG